MNKDEINGKRREAYKQAKAKRDAAFHQDIQLLWVDFLLHALYSLEEGVLMKIPIMLSLQVSVAIFSCTIFGSDRVRQCDTNEKVFRTIELAAFASSMGAVGIDPYSPYKEPDSVKALPKYLREQIELGFTIDSKEDSNILVAILSIGDYSKHIRTSLLHIILKSEIKNVQIRRAHLEEALQLATTKKEASWSRIGSEDFDKIIELLYTSLKKLPLDIYRYEGKFDWDIKVIHKIMAIPLLQKELRRQLLAKVLDRKPICVMARSVFLYDARSYVLRKLNAATDEEKEEIKVNLQQIDMALNVMPYWEQLL